MTQIRSEPIYRLTSAWIPEKKELGHLILPSDARYYSWGSSAGPLLQQEKQKIIEDIFSLLRADILRVSPEEIPERLPDRLPRAILQTWAKENNIPSEREAWWIDFIDTPSEDWCHHDPQLGYSVAKLLCIKYESRLLRGWRVCGAPGYAGGIADLGLIDPKGECVIAVEIGDTYPHKFVEAFSNTKLRQLWHFRYHGLLGRRHYEWERKGVYFIWTRGTKWGQRSPSWQR